jgi:hypothetical protein
MASRRNRESAGIAAEKNVYIISEFYSPPAASTPSSLLPEKRLTSAGAVKDGYTPA